GALVEVQLSVPACVTGDDPRCHESEHPADISGGHEMQRAADRPRADDAALCDSFFNAGFGGVRQAKADRPLSAGEVLRLHRAEIRDHLGGSTKVLLSDMLVAQPQTRDVHAAHRLPYYRVPR